MVGMNPLTDQKNHTRMNLKTWFEVYLFLKFIIVKGIVMPKPELKRNEYSCGEIEILILFIRKESN